MKKNKGSVAIIGAGIAGLCSAYWLEKRGFKVDVFEKNAHVGGAIITRKEAGFLIDLGPNSTLETSKVLKDLVDEIGLAGEKIYGNDESNKRYIIKNGKLTAIPTSPFGFITTPLFSWKAKLRLLKEPFIKPSKDKDISLADFVTRRLGREFLDYAINPFVAGVYAGDPTNLSTSAGFPKLYALEQKYGSLIKGAFLGARERKKRQEVAKDRARLFSFKDGMSTLPERLAAQLTNEIQTETTIKSIKPLNDGFTIDYESRGQSHESHYDKVILCTPTHVTSKLIQGMDENDRKLLSEVYHPPVNVVYMGYKETDVQIPMDGFGFLIPEVEKRNILGAIWSSTIFPGRAPEGHVAITCFVGGTRQPHLTELSDDDLLKVVKKELKDLMHIENDPVFHAIKNWPKAIPQYRMGYQNIQEIFNSLESRHPGLYFAGNFRRGISVGDSVLSAHEVCESIK